MTTIPATISVRATIWPTIPAGVLLSFSSRNTAARRMEMSGSAAVMMDRTGAIRSPLSWKALWFSRKPTGPTTARA